MKTEFRIVEKFLLRCDYLVPEQVVPLYDQEAIAGIISQTIDDYVPLEEITIPDMPKCDGAVHVKGYSMYPLLNAGDIILYKTTQSRKANLFFGEMYLVVFDLDGEEFVTVKFLHKSTSPGFYRLESFNREYPPAEVEIDRVRALALVKGCIKYNNIE